MILEEQDGQIHTILFLIVSDFYIKITISTSTSVHPSLCASVRVSVQRLAPIPAGESQNVTNKNCSICLRG